MTATFVRPMLASPSNLEVSPDAYLDGIPKCLFFMLKVVTGQIQTSNLNWLAHSFMANSAPAVALLESSMSTSLTWVEANMALLKDQARENDETVLIFQAKADKMIKVKL